MNFILGLPTNFVEATFDGWTYFIEMGGVKREALLLTAPPLGLQVQKGLYLLFVPVEPLYASDWPIPPLLRSGAALTMT